MLRVTSAVESPPAQVDFVFFGTEGIGIARLPIAPQRGIHGHGGIQQPRQIVRQCVRLARHPALLPRILLGHLSMERRERLVLLRSLLVIPYECVAVS